MKWPIFRPIAWFPNKGAHEYAGLWDLEVGLGAHEESNSFGPIKDGARVTKGHEKMM